MSGKQHPRSNSRTVRGWGSWSDSLRSPFPLIFPSRSSSEFCFQERFSRSTVAGATLSGNAFLLDALEQRSNTWNFSHRLFSEVFRTTEVSECDYDNLFHSHSACVASALRDRGPTSLPYLGLRTPRAGGRCLASSPGLWVHPYRQAHLIQTWKRAFLISCQIFG